MLDFHRVLIADEIRTRAFREAIRSVVTPDSVVLDLGCGSGILSFFACEAGARRVFAVEHQHTADAAAFMSRRLGVADRMEVIHMRSSEAELPERATVLITETLGAFGLEERIMGHVIDARTRLITSDAAIIPLDVTLLLVPVELPAEYELHVDEWSKRRYGIDLSPLRVFASNAIYLLKETPDAYLAPPAPILSVDLRSVAAATVSGEARFEIARRGVMHGFAGWFRASLTPSISVTNEDARATHWHHAFLPLENAMPVEAGTSVSVILDTDDGKWWRWRGTVGSQPFDQATWFSMPPCMKGRAPQGA